MEDMYVWKVILEVQYKSTWKEGGKSKSDLWEEQDKEFTVAAPSGRVAITKAEKIALAEEPWVGEHYLEDDKSVPTQEAPYKVLDVVYLDLLQTLDG